MLSLSPSTRRLLAAAVALSGVVVLVIADGARRRPPNPNAPLALRGAHHLAPPSDDQALRIATFNIRGGKGRDHVRDLGRIAATLEGVDVALLQEVHGSPFGTGDQSADLGERLKLASLFCPTETRWWGDSFGNGLLTRKPVELLQRLPLAGTQDRRFRSALLTVVPLGGQRVRILSVHLDDRCDHDAQLQTLIDLFLSLEQPSVLLGDLNTTPADPQWKRLAKAQGVTAVLGERWPDRKPLRGVDWIVVRGLSCRHVEPRDFGGSDHAALVAELVLPQDAAGSEQPGATTSSQITETISAGRLPSRR